MPSPDLTTHIERTRNCQEYRFLRKKRPQWPGVRFPSAARLSRECSIPLIIDNLRKAPAPPEVMPYRLPARREKIRLLLNVFSNVATELRHIRQPCPPMPVTSRRQRQSWPQVPLGIPSPSTRRLKRHPGDGHLQG